MIDKINDIKKALEAEAYLSALALVLTLPDICGKIQYPTFGSKRRYVQWYDENVSKYDYPKGFDEKLKFDGSKCYELRCAFLHSGNTKDISINKFELSIQKPNRGVYAGTAYESQWENDDIENKKYSIRLEVHQFCFILTQTAKAFYETNKEKFVDHRVTIINMDEEFEKIKNLNRL